MENGVYQVKVVDYLDTVRPLIVAKVGKAIHDNFWSMLIDNDKHIACGVVLHPSWDYVYEIIKDVQGYKKKQTEWINEKMKNKRHEETKKEFLKNLEEDCAKREALKACLPDIKAVIDEFEKQDVYYRFFW